MTYVTVFKISRLHHEYRKNSILGVEKRKKENKTERREAHDSATELLRERR